MTGMLQLRFFFLIVCVCVCAHINMATVYASVSSVSICKCVSHPTIRLALKHNKQP